MNKDAIKKKVTIQRWSLYSINVQIALLALRSSKQALENEQNYKQNTFKGGQFKFNCHRKNTN